MSDMVVEVSPMCARLAASTFFEKLPERPDSIHAMASAGVPFNAAGDARDAFALLADIAHGDLGAMRELASASAYLVLSESDCCDPIVTLSEGLMIARLAACLGDDGDAMQLVAMLSLAAVMARDDAALDLAGEAVARLELLADGDGEVSEAAAQLLATGADHEAPEVLERAKFYRTRIIAAQENR